MAEKLKLAPVNVDLSRWRRGKADGAGGFMYPATLLLLFILRPRAPLSHR